MKTASTTESTSNSKHAKSAAAKPMSEGVSRELRNFIADIEDLIKTTGALSDDSLDEMKTTIRDRIASAKQSLGEITGTIDETARKTAEKTNEYVHDQPWKSIGISAATGVLLGIFLSRRSKESS